MKRIVVLLIALGAILASCSTPTASSGGTLRIILPASSRAVMDGVEVGDHVRVQLARNGVIVPLSGGTFIEHSLPSGDISIDGLAPGSGYVLYVSTGQYNSGETFYRTTYFGKSDAFEISAGTDTAVSATLAGSRFTVLEAASGAHAITSPDGAVLYFANGSELDRDMNNGSGQAVVSQYRTNYAPSGVQVQGLGHDNTGKLWLNTDKGVSVDNGSFQTPAMSDSNGSISPSVTDSGKFILSGNSLAYYYGAGRTAGVQTTSSGTTWETLDELISTSNELKEKLTGQVIRSVVSTPYFGVLSTSIGSFRVESGMLNDNDALSNALTSGKFNGVSIDVEPSDTSLSVTPVSAYSDGSTTGLVFEGTAKGLYAGNVNATTGVPTSADGTLPLVSDTLGLNITKLATYGSLVGGNVVTVAYSDSSRELLVLHGTTVFTRYSAFEGLPSGDLRLALYLVGSTLYAAVSGTDATVRINVTP